MQTFLLLNICVALLVGYFAKRSLERPIWTAKQNGHEHRHDAVVMPNFIGTIEATKNNGKETYLVNYRAIETGKVMRRIVLDCVDEKPNFFYEQFVLASDTIFLIANRNDSNQRYCRAFDLDGKEKSASAATFAGKDFVGLSADQRAFFTWKKPILTMHDSQTLNVIWSMEINHPLATVPRLSPNRQHLSFYTAVGGEHTILFFDIAQRELLKPVVFRPNEINADALQPPVSMVENNHALFTVKLEAYQLGNPIESEHVRYAEIDVDLSADDPEARFVKSIVAKNSYFGNRYGFSETSRLVTPSQRWLMRRTVGPSPFWKSIEPTVKRFALEDHAKRLFNPLADRSFAFIEITDSAGQVVWSCWNRSSATPTALSDDLILRRFDNRLECYRIYQLAFRWFTGLFVGVCTLFIGQKIATIVLRRRRTPS